jgi:hypothetical protein
MPQRDVYVAMVNSYKVYCAARTRAGMYAHAHECWAPVPRFRNTASHRFRNAALASLAGSGIRLCNRR